MLKMASKRISALPAGTAADEVTLLVAIGAGLVAIAMAIALVNLDPPKVIFGLFVAYGLSGYVVYAVRRSRGMQTSVISTSTDEPDERGLH